MREVCTCAYFFLIMEGVLARVPPTLLLSLCVSAQLQSLLSQASKKKRGNRKWGLVEGGGGGGGEKQIKTNLQVCACACVHVCSRFFFSSLPLLVFFLLLLPWVLVEDAN